MNQSQSRNEAHGSSPTSCAGSLSECSHNATPRNGVTVTQYEGPTIRFESPEEYAKWLFNDGHEDPDHAVNLHENWDDPSREQENQDAIDEMITRAEREMRHSR